MIRLPKTGSRMTVMVLAAIVLAGCSLPERLANVGATPALSAIENPTQAPEYRPISLPLPTAQPAHRNKNSLWRAGARAFFKDQRAAEVGDLVTVVIDLDDSATINNSTSRSRTSAETATLPSFLGYEQSLGRILPEAIDPTSLVDAGATGSHAGVGSITRDEAIKIKVAAIVTQILPNGNMVVRGRQEVRVNFEVRELQIAGIIRPEDISSANTVLSEKVAEARIAYGGRGQITDVQQPRYGQQVYDILFPF